MSLSFPKASFFPLLLAPLLAGCGKEEKPKDDTPPAPVHVTKVSTGQVLKQWTEVLGTTQAIPDKAGLITAPVEGQVLWVLGGDKGPRFEEGQWVKKGDVIVQLNDKVLQANAAKLEAGLRKLVDQKKQADIAIQVARIDVDRYETLKKQKIPVAPSDEQKAGLSLQDAQLKRQALETDQQAAQEELKALRVQIGLYALRAPLDGKLSKLEVVAGQTLSVGSRVAEVVNLADQIDVLCWIPPASIKHIHLNVEAELYLTEGAATPGRVVFIGDQAQAETGNFPVKVRFPNLKLHLLVNEVGWVRILTLVKDNADTLPESAVLEDQEPPVVVVVRAEKEKNAEGKEEDITRAYRLPVKLGIRDRDNHRIEIEAILDPEHPDTKTPAQKRAEVENLVYVTEGAQGLQDKDEVKVEEEKEKKKE